MHLLLNLFFRKPIVQIYVSYAVPTQLQFRERIALHLLFEIQNDNT